MPYPLEEWWIHLLVVYWALHLSYLDCCVQTSYSGWSTSLLLLKVRPSPPCHIEWVPHIMCFVVLIQMLIGLYKICLHISCLTRPYPLSKLVFSSSADTIAAVQSWQYSIVSNPCWLYVDDVAPCFLMCAHRYALVAVISLISNVERYRVLLLIRVFIMPVKRAIRSYLYYKPYSS